MLHSASIFDITFNVNRGTLVGVVGDPGAGKSALIKALLGEMAKTSGDVNIVTNVAYVPQKPCLQSGTLRDNILFGKSLDDGKLARVVVACGLGGCDGKWWFCLSFR